MDLGLGLWTMRAPAAFPAPQARLYRQLREDAQLAERLGYHSLWIAEHHFWYDNWCPSPLVAAASALAATTRLHVGTGIHLLPIHDADRVAGQLAWLQELSGGRLEYGVGLGYRAAEYDGYGRSRRTRGKRMDAGLDRVLELAGPDLPIWIGGMAKPALERAAQRGLGVMLPSTLDLAQLQAAIAAVRETADAAGRAVRIATMKYAWPTDGTASGRRRAEDMLATWTREYAGAWFPLRGRPGFASPDLLDGQMDRSARTALIGSPAELAEQLAELEAAGAELCVVHLVGDGRMSGRGWAMESIAEHVLPGLTATTATAPAAVRA